MELIFTNRLCESYNLPLEELEQMIADYLNINVKAISLSFEINNMDEVSNIHVDVSKTL